MTRQIVQTGPAGLVRLECRDCGHAWSPQDPSEAGVDRSCQAHWRTCPAWKQRGGEAR